MKNIHRALAATAAMVVLGVCGASTASAMKGDPLPPLPVNDQAGAVQPAAAGGYDTAITPITAVDVLYFLAGADTYEMCDLYTKVVDEFSVMEDYSTAVGVADAWVLDMYAENVSYNHSAAFTVEGRDALLNFLHSC